MRLLYPAVDDHSPAPACARRRRGAAASLVALTLALVAGCGQTGALYLPETDAPATGEAVVSDDPDAVGNDGDDDTP